MSMSIFQGPAVVIHGGGGKRGGCGKCREFGTFSYFGNNLTLCARIER